MTAITPAQAAYEALHRSIGQRQPRHVWVVWESVDEINDGIPGEPLREDMEAAAQAAIDAATEGSLRACGYTLADIGRFLEAEAAAHDGRHPDGCACQFCREDEREERDREELDDDTDNTIPDTEGDDW